jgi:hypothetical protein
MQLINTDGMSFIGPGSEWFWTAISGVVLAGTALAIYRQLRGQNAANVVQRMEALQGRWESPRMIHSRLVIALWRKDSAGLGPDYDVQIAINWVCGFFDDLADLERHGYLDWDEIQPTWAQPLIIYWALTGQAIRELRAASPMTFRAFEQLVSTAVDQGRRRGEDWSIPESELPAVIEAQIGRNSARLQMLRDVESGVLPTEAMFAKEVVVASEG